MRCHCKATTPTRPCAYARGRALFDGHQVHGVPVLPSFCFGELEAVSAVSPLPSAVAKWLQKTFRMSTTCFVGRWNLFPAKARAIHLVLWDADTDEEGGGREGDGC